MCVLKKLSLPFACLVLSFSSGLAHAADSPSFDCKKASSSVEKAICGDPKLMALDVDLAASYKKLRAERYPRALNPWLVSTQRDWLKMRKSCPLNGMQVCLIDSYSKRLFELELTESYVNRSWGDTATILKLHKEIEDNLHRPQMPHEADGYYPSEIRRLRSIALTHDLGYSKAVLGFDNYEGQKQWEKYVFGVCNWFSVPEDEDSGSQGNREEENCYAEALAHRRELLANVMHALSR